MLVRTADAETAFELIGRARVSTSAPEARRLGLLPEGAGITMNPERLVDDAKHAALTAARCHIPATPRDEIEVGGENVYARLKLKAWMEHQAGRATGYDTVVAGKLAFVLSGGRLTGKQTAPEQYLLDLEREAFLSLCGNEKTQERIRHMLTTGKPLRN
jgi:3-hydroxyacyl-CoA dehydrogenase